MPESIANNLCIYSFLTDLANTIADDENCINQIFWAKYEHNFF